MYPAKFGITACSGLDPLNIARVPKVTMTNNNSNDINENRFSSVKNLFIEFKNELKKISYKLNDYIGDREMEIFIRDLDKQFTLMGMNLKYCLKEK